MPDISKCSWINCPLKESCYRYTAKSSEYWQAYFTSVPYNHEDNDCEYYWFNKTEL